MLGQEPDPPLQLLDGHPSPASPSFKAHLAQFVAPPSLSSTLRQSPRKRPLRPASPSPSVSEQLRATPERKPSLSRRRSTQTPPRADGTSPHFNAKSQVNATSTARESGMQLPYARDEVQRKKKKKPSRPYADPSTYSELGDNPLLDYLEDDLDLLLCGINPGVKSAQMQQHYASPTNHFWKCLAGSGLTDRLLHPSEGAMLPGSFGIGSTNLVPRPSAEMSELSNDEMRACVPAFLRKLFTYKPRLVAFVRMKICEVVFRYLHASSPTATTSEAPESPATTPKKKPAMPKIKLGLQPVTISLPSEGGPSPRKILFWCLPSTSARVVAYQLVDKIRIFGELKNDVEALKAGRLELPHNAIEYREEDLSNPPVHAVTTDSGRKDGACRVRGCASRWGSRQ